MSQLLEAVPNFSEGRDQETIAALAAALGSRARLLDVHSDPDHNRSVFTLAGWEQELVAALIAGVAVAIECIDLSRHDGVHPCVGVADVLPLVALGPQDLERAGRPRSAGASDRSRARAACLPLRRAGGRAPARGVTPWRRCGAGPAARERRARARLRACAARPARGAVLVGARLPLIAFNVNLRGSLEAAMEIARVVRESGGGFAGVRALGLELPGAGLVQVSMNIEDWRESGPGEIVARIEREAAKRGAEVAGCELVGLIPAGAAAEAERAGLHFDRQQILERRLPPASRRFPASRRELSRICAASSTACRRNRAVKPTPRPACGEIVPLPIESNLDARGVGHREVAGWKLLPASAAALVLTVMATKKQRRRREKELRHEYEYVYIDEEGNEVEVEQPPSPRREKEHKAVASGNGRPRPGSRPMRPVQPPTWRYMRKQALIFIVILFAVFMLFSGKKLGLLGVATLAIVYTAVMMPVMWMMQRTMYRSYLRRTGQPLPEKKRNPK